MKKIVMVCAVAGVLAAGGIAWARDGGGQGGPDQRGSMKGFGPGHGGAAWLVRHEGVAKDLGVTEEQLGQLREMAYQGEVQQIKGRAELEIARMELHRLLDSAKPTQEAADKAIEKISALETQLQKARVGEMLKVREILGEEKFGKIRDAMKDRMREHMMNRPVGPRGERQGMRQRGSCPAPLAPAAPPETDDDDKDD